MSPLMFVHPFTQDFLGKSSQWVTLTRASAVAAVHDRIVEPWFETFAGVHWRCNFVSETLQVCVFTTILAVHFLFPTNPILYHESCCISPPTQQPGLR